MNFAGEVKVMIIHSYPLLISVYKGEGRVLIVPLIDHVAGYSIDSDAEEIGKAVIDAFIESERYYNID